MAAVKQTRKPRSRTYARNRHTVSRKGISKSESDSQYFLKLVIILLLGTLWIKFSAPTQWHGFTLTALPVGILVGIILVKLYEKSDSDRKIWYAVLLTVGIISYFVPAGIIF